MSAIIVKRPFTFERIESDLVRKLAVATVADEEHLYVIRAGGVPYALVFSEHAWHDLSVVVDLLNKEGPDLQSFLVDENTRLRDELEQALDNVVSLEIENSDLEALIAVLQDKDKACE